MTNFYGKKISFSIEEKFVFHPICTQAIVEIPFCCLDCLHKQSKYQKGFLYFTQTLPKYIFDYKNELKKLP